ncbi:hypothetical protein ACIQAC_01230 [Streptomyces sp. NPDC088387]|uniref:hypothetical protein n=1 Tax=Streptomyces sp. NPDC088387 TaxID=3365859 RepID=UPI00381227F4
MTFIEFPIWQPGMIVTEARANSAALVGRTVFRATRDANQSISTSASANPDIANALSWETIGVDDLGGWSSGSATRYTCQLAGWYKIQAKAGFNASVSGTARTLGIFITGGLAPGGHFRTATTFTNTTHTRDGFLTALLGVGDYVQIAPGQDTGGALNTATGGIRPTLEIEFARPA